MLRTTLFLGCALALITAFAPAPARRAPVVGLRAALLAPPPTARTALRARDDETPEQPEYDVEPIFGNGNWQYRGQSPRQYRMSRKRVRSRSYRWW